jgi:Ni,Fe-hydrogenase I large subunit
MTRLVVGPFNRVEGDLEVTLDIGDGAVRAAYVNSPMFRGFEQILQGKDPFDALVFAPRICGICSVSQSAAAAQALADAMNLQPADNGRIAANLLLANENLADHFTHFYLFFMPDFARAEYAGRPWFAAAEARFKAVAGSATREILPARARFLHLMGLLAGKWPHTLALQPGGSSRPLQGSERIRVHLLLREFRAFLEQRLFGDRLETIAALDSLAALRDWMQARPASAAGVSDFRLFLEIAHDLELWRLGRAGELFMSFGNYPQADARLLPAGVWNNAARTVEAVDEALIREDLSHAWFDGGAVPAHPSQGTTHPLLDKPGAYSWCKAPRLGGRVVETGALARQLVAGQALARDLAGQWGGNVFARVVMRLVEIARVLPEMERWCGELRIGEPYCSQGEMPDECSGTGLVESARGALGHWLSVKRGHIHNYQIVAPTTWNFSPRDAGETPGALEQALVGAPVGPDEKTPLAVQHIVRSFDPCMVCTVH